METTTFSGGGCHLLTCSSYFLYKKQFGVLCMYKNKNILQSMKFATIGFFKAVKSEKNFKFYLANVIVTLIINILLDFSFFQYMLWLFSFFCVFSAECINTAIEKLCDMITMEKSKQIEDIKDIAAGAVMVFGMMFYIVEIINVVVCLINDFV